MARFGSDKHLDCFVATSMRLNVRFNSLLLDATTGSVAKELVSCLSQSVGGALYRKILPGSQLSAPGRTRTCNPWFRRPVLYPLSYGRIIFCLFTFFHLLLMIA